jgi:DNA-binding CsgD family transcriptional regulator
MTSKLIAGNQHLHTHMDGLFIHALGNAFWKDTNGKYLGSNQNELDLLGITAFNDLIGKDDREIMDLAPANTCRKNDQEVLLSGNCMVFIESPVKEMGEKSCISYKMPLYNSQGKTIGTFGIGYKINSLPSQEEILNEILLFAGPIARNLFRQTFLNLKQSQFKLSARQIECLDLLAKGMTYKQIATTLNLSSRTVEHYIETIKTKLDCESRHDLITKYLNETLNS